MAEASHLYGSCACERNQYVVAVPVAAAQQAQVFFDNSRANRRSQASPVTAWLRVPLDWYHSATLAQFPDESHALIKRTFYDPSPAASTTELPQTRRQFCGYCGTHLTAWDETTGDGEVVDVTLGSLLSDSLDMLESLGLLSDSSDSDDAEPEEDEDEIDSEMVKGGRVDADAHVETGRTPIHNMRGRGMPWFENMVENSRLGRIKRQKGGQTSSDGMRTVLWEVVELEPDGDETMAEEASGETSNKRRKIGD